LGLSGTSSQEQIVGSIVHREASVILKPLAARARGRPAEQSRDEERFVDLRMNRGRSGEQIELQKDLVRH